MRNADARGDRAGVVDVAAGAAGALAVGRRAMIVELQRDADHVVAGVGQQRRGDRRIDAARHGDDDARVGRPSLDVETVHAWRSGRAPFSSHYYKCRAAAPPWHGRSARAARLRRGGSGKICRAGARAAVLALPPRLIKILNLLMFFHMRRAGPPVASRSLRLMSQGSRSVEYASNVSATPAVAPSPWPQHAGGDPGNAARRCAPLCGPARRQRAAAADTTTTQPSPQPRRPTQRPRPTDQLRSRKLSHAGADNGATGSGRERPDAGRSSAHGRQPQRRLPATETANPGRKLITQRPIQRATTDRDGQCRPARAATDSAGRSARPCDAFAGAVAT